MQTIINNNNNSNFFNHEHLWAFVVILKFNHGFTNPVIFLFNKDFDF